MRNDIENCPFVPDCLRPNDRAALIVNFSKGDDKPSQQSSTIFFFSRSNCNKYVLRIFFTKKKKKKKKRRKIRSRRIERIDPLTRSVLGHDLHGTTKSFVFDRSDITRTTSRKQK